VEAEYWGARDMGTSVETLLLFPESRGGRVRIRADVAGWRSGENDSSDDDRKGSINCGGIGGGAKSDVKMPSPTDRCGEGQ
jgi:hypothetical protein